MSDWASRAAPGIIRVLGGSFIDRLVPAGAGWCSDCMAWMKAKDRWCATCQGTITDSLDLGPDAVAAALRGKRKR